MDNIEKSYNIEIIGESNSLTVQVLKEHIKIIIQEESRGNVFRLNHEELVALAQFLNTAIRITSDYESKNKLF